MNEPQTKNKILIIHKKKKKYSFCKLHAHIEEKHKKSLICRCSIEYSFHSFTLMKLGGVLRKQKGGFAKRGLINAHTGPFIYRQLEAEGPPCFALL